MEYLVLVRSNHVFFNTSFDMEKYFLKKLIKHNLFNNFFWTSERGHTVILKLLERCVSLKVTIYVRGCYCSISRPLMDSIYFISNLLDANLVIWLSELVNWSYQVLTQIKTCWILHQSLVLKPAWEYLSKNELIATLFILSNCW